GGGKGGAELRGVEEVLGGGVPGELGGAHGAPGDAVARIVEAAERAGQSLDVRQQVLLRHEYAVEHELAGDRGAQRQLALDLRGGDALAALDDEAADDAVELRPYHRDVGDRRVGDPHLGAGELEPARRLIGARHHRAGIRAVVRLGEAEAADNLAGGEL